MKIFRGLAACAALGLWLYAGPAAAAPDKASAGQAKVHAQRGQRLYDLRRFDDAIKEFEKAYEMGGDPSYLFNLAQAYRLANRTESAVRYYEIYLQRVPDAPNRADIESRVADLKKQLAAGPVPAPAPAPAPTAGSVPTPGLPPVPPERPAPASPSPERSPALPHGSPADPMLEAARQGVHTHDGAFVRLTLGGGRLRVSSKLLSEDVAAYGIGAHLTAAFGVALSRYLVVYGEVLQSLAQNPSLQMGTVTVKTDGAALSIFGAGLGAAFYVMPLNAYLSATGGMHQMEIEFGNGTKGNSRWGPGVTVSAGKEFWVGSQWGLGAAAHFHYSRMKDQDDVSGSRPTWTSTWYGLAISATYN